MIPKFKSKQTHGNRLMGTYIDGAPWVTNGHWAAVMDTVGGLTVEQVSAFDRGDGWEQTRDKFVIKTPGVTLDFVRHIGGFDMIECNLSPVSLGDKKDRQGFTIDSDHMLQTYQWDYLTPLIGLALKCVRGKNTGVWAYDATGTPVAHVFPKRLDRGDGPEIMADIEAFRAARFHAWSTS